MINGDHLAKIMLQMLCDQAAGAVLNAGISVQQAHDQMSQAVNLFTQTFSAQFLEKLQARVHELMKLRRKVEKDDPSNKQANSSDQEEGKKPTLSEEELEVLRDFVKKELGIALADMVELEKEREKKPVPTEQRPIEEHPTAKHGDACEVCGNGRVYDTNEPQQQTYWDYVPG